MIVIDTYDKNPIFFPGIIIVNAIKLHFVELK